MVEQLTKNTVTELAKINEPVCISLYMPTHPAFPQRNENPVVFKNLLRDLRQQLISEHPDADHDTLLEPFEQLQEDEEFWTHQQNGLAVIGGADFFKVLRLPQAVSTRTFICSHPYLTPLIRITQAADNYQVLCLTRDAINLFEGNRDSLTEISLHPDVPTTKEEALGSELTPGDQTGFQQGFGAAGQRGDPYAHESGGNDKQAEIDIDRERYFRAVDKAILEHHSRPSSLPLILAALPENQAFYREVSHNPFLQEQGVNPDLSNLDTDKLQQACWQLMSSHFNEQIDEMVQQFKESEHQGLASDKLADIEQAAETGRVATLLVEADRLNVAKIDKYDASNEHPDMLEELVLTVIQHGGDIMVMPPQRLSTKTGAAAVYRF